MSTDVEQMHLTDLMPEEVRVDALLNPCCQGVLMNDLTDATLGIGPEAVRLEEKNCPVILQSFILEQFTPEAGWKQDTAVLTSLALHESAPALDGRDGSRALGAFEGKPSCPGTNLRLRDRPLS